MQSPRNAQEVKASFAFEARMKPYMDAWYLSRGHRIVTRQGNKQYDLKLVLRGFEDEWLVEEKFRRGIYGDLLIELMQDVVTGEPGWFHHTRCQSLHYVFCNGERGAEKPALVYCLHWQPFKNWLVEWAGTTSHHNVINSRRGYGLTLNLVVPVRVIPSHLYHKIEMSS